MSLGIYTINRNHQFSSRWEEIWMTEKKEETLTLSPTKQNEKHAERNHFLRLTPAFMYGWRCNVHRTGHLHNLFEFSRCDDEKIEKRTFMFHWNYLNYWSEYKITFRSKSEVILTLRWNFLIIWTKGELPNANNLSFFKLRLQLFNMVLHHYISL